MMRSPERDRLRQGHLQVLEQLLRLFEGRGDHALVASLKAKRGLHAFAHFPEREHQLLLGIAERPDCALMLAYTPGGEIVGQVTLAPADTWWQGVANTYELAIEVSAHWRGWRSLVNYCLWP